MIDKLAHGTPTQGEQRTAKWKCGGCNHEPHGPVCLADVIDVVPCGCTGQPEHDVVCQHGTACDVHCCNCHSGYLFNSERCVCGRAEARETR